MKPSDPTSVGARPPAWWRTVALGVVMVAIAALMLLAMGRAPFCRCGRIALWFGDAWGPENSQQLFDPYSFTHILHGFLFYVLLKLVAPRWSLSARALATVALESMWEVMENTNAVIDRYREVTMALGYYGDTVLNSVGDILACVVGVMLAARLPVRACVALAVAIELILLVWIRDGLLLNLVMLIYPLDGVRAWQIGGQNP